MLILAFLLASCCVLQAEGRRLVFSPHWLPQAQFAGYYVAYDQGFYREAGLDVEIIHPSAAVNAQRFLEDGRADVISLFLVTGLKAACDGLPVVNFAQLSQQSAIMLVSKAESGIERLEDMEGKRIGIWMSGFQEVPQAMMEAHGVEVEWVPILSTVNLFLLGGVDVMTVMWYNEYNQLYFSGIDWDEMNTFFVGDYGFNIPEDGLYALEDTWEERQEDLRAFTEATLRGWEYADRHREYAVELVVDLMRRFNVPSNRAHQRWMLDKVLQTQSLEGHDVGITELHPDDFYHTLSILRNHYGQDFPIRYRDFFRPVLPELHKHQSQ